MILDSSYNAAPLSMRNVIDTAYSMRDKLFPDYDIWLILGDMRELGEDCEAEHKALGTYLLEKNPEKLFTVGESMKKYLLPELKDKLGNSQHVFHYFDSKEAGEKIVQLLETSDKKVLLIAK